MDLESFMDNDDDLDNAFLVKKEDDEIDEDHQLSQIEKGDMYRVCKVNRVDMFNQNSKKMEKVLNQQMFQQNTADRHHTETFVSDLKSDANPKHTSDTKELLDYVP